MSELSVIPSEHSVLALPTLAYLHECLSLDSNTGVLIWLHRPREHFATLRGCSTWLARYAGRVAGAIGPGGYLKVCIKDVRYQAHRVVFAMHHGIEMRDLPGTLDHINGVVTDNRPANLRPATKAQNAHNSRRPITNRSGFRGVSWHARWGRWIAQITIGGQHHNLGAFDTPEAASAAYEAAAAELHGDFYRPDENALLAGAA